MAHREFRDSAGLQWAVWSVHPEYAERRAGDRSGGPVPPQGAERRQRAEYRVPLAGDFAHGWLCFERPDEKRRLSPYPANWANMTDDELGKLCGEAKKVGKR